MWKLALTLSFLIYVIKSQEFVFLSTSAGSDNGTNNIFFCVLPPAWPP